MTPATPIRIGTRGSALALAQANLVADLLTSHGALTALVIVRTQGDRDQASSLAAIGGQGVFTSALQDALLGGTIDVAVHSAKDLPSTEHDRLELAAFLSRQDARDVLVARSARGLDELPAGARIGTSSRRRIAELRAQRPDIEIVDIRGNIDTRIRLGTEGDLDGVILAAAGLQRMGWQDRISAYLPLDRFVPAPSQAALAIEVRRGDDATRNAVALLDEPVVRAALRAERAVLRALGAGCSTPVGAHATVSGDGVHLRVMMASSDMADAEWGNVELPADSPEAGAADLAFSLRRAIRHRRRGSRREHGEETAPRILVTRPEPGASSLAAALTAAGAEPVMAPMLRAVPVQSASLDTAREGIAAGEYDWVVFPSANAVEGLFPDGGRPDAAWPRRTRVAAVGQRTAERLRLCGLQADLVPEQADAAGLVAALVAAGISGAAVLLAQGNLARSELADGLRAAGATVTAVETYHVDVAGALDPDVSVLLYQGDIDAVTFASPSAMTTLTNLLSADPSIISEVPAVCIGETTAAAARDAGWAVAAVADEPSDAGLVEVVMRVLPGVTVPRTPSSDERRP